MSFFLLFLTFSCTFLVSFSSHNRRSKRSSSSSDSDKRVSFLDGFVTYGTNNYNGQFIWDTSDITSSIPFLVQSNLYEIGIYNPNGDKEILPTEDTDRNLLISTTNNILNALNVPSDPNLVNIPVNEIGTLALLSEERIVVNTIDKTDFGSIYKREGAIDDITLGDWDKISGKIKITKLSEDLYELKLIVCNAIPSGLYGIWDIGVTDSKTSNESFYAIPAGGIPNIFTTDINGYGTYKWYQNHNPVQKCVMGGTCGAYFPVYFYWDNMVYGTSNGLGSGITGANHLIFPLNGDILIKPQNNFKRCRRRDGSSSFSSSSWD